MKVSILVVALFGVIASFQAQLNTPEWVKNATIYEINTRQFSDEGNFRQVTAQLPRLKEMGVDIIWLMPIHPIGLVNRKGSLGSYYAVQDYRAINPEYGTEVDLIELVNTAHQLGMKVIIDWVANHTSPDNVWLEQGHKDWYTLDKNGNIQPTIGTDWTDVADLNFDSKEMRAEMIASMAYWVKEFQIDGFRCDVAGWVPMEFWNEARKELDQIKPLFFLAEAEGAELHSAFEMTYGWDLHHIMNDVAQGKKGADELIAYFEKPKMPNNGFHMNFTSNHDENSWNGTEMERMGDARFAFAVFAATVEGMPLIYNGQETSLDRRLKFFEKDPINWDKMDQVAFYAQLMRLHQTNSALFVGKGQAAPRFISTKADKSHLVYVRERDGHQVLVVLNLSAKAKTINFNDAATTGKYTELFSSEEATFNAAHSLKLGAWGYKVYYR
ncbi:MAG: hypothetical protein RLZZ301_1661 [Bacteroidota bacterium]|jgi:glycosidase